MKACFPVARDLGIESRVYPHFGSAPMFVVVDTETRSTRAIANPRDGQAPGRCHPVGVLVDEGVDAVVVGGIGAGALDRLREARIRVYHTARGTAGEALDALVRDALPPLLPDDGFVHGPGRRGGRRHRHGRRGMAGQGPHRFRGGRGA